MTIHDANQRQVFSPAAMQNASALATAAQNATTAAAPAAQYTPPYQDGLFRLLFSDKEHLLELYNAVTGSNYGPETKVEITTLETEIFDRKKNDISFLLDDKLIVFVEQQSTVNPNMPLRFLLYAAKTYGKMVPKNLIYSRKVIPLPSPEFFVFYTGTQDFPEQKTLRLSDSFMEPGHGDLELKVQCFNINYPSGAKMLERSKTLQDYSLLIHRIRQKCAAGFSLEAAIDEAIRTCKEENILTAFLNDHEGEMRGMLFRYLNDDEFRKVYTECGYYEGHDDGLKEGMAQGLEAGARQNALQTAAKLKAMGLPVSQISEATGLSEEEIKTL